VYLWQPGHSYFFNGFVEAVRNVPQVQTSSTQAMGV
jgi:hypothetical protein